MLELIQPSYFAYPEYSTDFSDIFDTDLFNSAFADDLTQMGGIDPQLIDPQLIDPQLIDTSLTSFVDSLVDPASCVDPPSDTPYCVDPPSLANTPSLADTPSLVVDNTPSPVSVSSDTLSEKLTTIAPVKVGGLGKARKGTVQSGGVVKKTTSRLFLTDCPTGSEAGEDDDELPQDWRPPPEVLAKMTSKEKRQLRNKISARNFRVRRKEYITTLEGDIAERDRLLDHFRTKLGSRESENLALRQEIATLKKALLDGRGITKDLPTSPRIAGPQFWGGVGMGGGGVTPVHTTLVPDISTIVRKGLQENVNPSLNALRDTTAGNGIGPNKALGGFDGFADLNPFTMKTLDAYRMHLWNKMAAQQQMHQQNQASQNHHNSSSLASNLRPHFFSTSPKPNLPSSAGYGGTLSALLSGKHNVPYSSSSSYPTPPTSPILHPKGGASLPLPLLHSSQTSSAAASQSPSLSSTQKEQQHAVLAAMASQTVFRKLGSAFWDAFTGSSSSSTSSRGDWDADKVRKILEGKAVLRVVDVEPVAVPAAAPLSSVSSTLTTPSISPKWKGAASRSSFSQLRSTATSTSSTSSNSSHATEDGGRMSCKTAACASVCEILEESMRSLSMGKKM